MNETVDSVPTVDTVVPTVDTARLETAAAGVTRGPWQWVEYRHRPPNLVGRGGEPGGYEYDTEVLEVTHDGGCGCRLECILEMNIAAADKEWIAAAKRTSNTTAAGYGCCRTGYERKCGNGAGMPHTG